MALPNKPIEFNLDPDDLTVGEAIMLESKMPSLAAFRDFMANHSNWTAEEIEALKLSELRTVAGKLREQLQERAVPLQTSPN